LRQLLLPRQPQLLLLLLQWLLPLNPQRNKSVLAHKKADVCRLFYWS
jgi:hypothetical protein